MTNATFSPTITAPFARDLAVAVVPSADGPALALPFEDRNTMFGVLHGGALASLVPIAASAAVRGRAPDAVPCTASLHMEYVRAARKPVIATTRSIRQVRELEFFDTEISDGDGQPIAFASSVITTGAAAAALRAPAAAAPLAAGAPDLARAIQNAIAASPYLARRQVGLDGSDRGAVQLRLPAAPVNLDADGRIHEGAAMTLIDAAGATCPYTTGAVTAAGGATIALHIQILGPLPAADLIAHATVRARRARLTSVDVAVTSAGSGALHALGTVVYRSKEVTIT
jgi:uncharacterized protein (TIGR00369 family)